MHLASLQREISSLRSEFRSLKSMLLERLDADVPQSASSAIKKRVQFALDVYDDGSDYDGVSDDESVDTRPKRKKIIENVCL